MLIQFTTFSKGKDPVVRIRSSRSACTTQEGRLWDMFLTIGTGPWRLGDTFADEINEGR